MGKSGTSRNCFLNDFCWSEKLMSWQDLLKLLEGDTVHIALPKVYFLKDIFLNKDTLIFVTSIFAYKAIQKAEK